MKRRFQRALLLMAATLVLLPVLVLVGGSLYLKATQLEDTPFITILALVGGGALSAVECGVVGCEAELREGMESEVFDANLLRATPVALDVDEWGRVLIAETERMNTGTEDNRQHAGWLMDDLASRTVEDRVAYYRKWLATGEFEDPDHFTRAADRLVALVDADGDGVADRRQEIAAWSEMASGLVAGVESREGEILVTAIPSVYRVRDRDHDGEAEGVERLATGFGVKTSLIGHDLHGLVWGPDGKVYFTVGDRGYSVQTREGQRLEPSLGPGRGAVFRMNPDGTALEVFATGVRNPQELAFDDDGNLFTGDNNGDGGDRARLVYLVEGGETGWAMPYQTLVGDYVRGPWMAERLWEKQHPTQPAWVLPPVDYIGNGPAGLVHYPGLGLPERYADAFFLCDYGYTPGRSGIWSFRVEPDGAGMRMEALEPFAWSVLATDVDFSWDAHIYATVFDQFGGTQEVVRWSHPTSRADPRVAMLASIARTPTADLPTARLIELLDFPDQRLRLRAQYALAARDARTGLIEVARSPASSRRERLHAIWGLGQIGAEALEALTVDLGWLDQAPEEARAQLARVAGDAGLRSLVPVLHRWLQADSARVRFFAAQALGALGDRSAVGPLAAVLRENADADVFLRHAVVWAWHRIGDPEAVYGYRADPSRSVRMGVLLALRHGGDPRVADFLTDPDPGLVVEAARAIYDGPIEAAMAPLAGLAPSLSPVTEDDAQVGGALHRRVIGANVRLRSEAGALALARYALDDRHSMSLRRLALDALGRFDTPPLRDLTMGFYRPLPPTDPGLLQRVLEGEGFALLDSHLSSESIEIFSRVGALRLSGEKLVEVAGDPLRTTRERVAALEALSRRANGRAVGQDLSALVDLALSGAEPTVRIAGRDLQWAIDPRRGAATLLEAAGDAPTLAERQQAWQRLAGIDAPGVDAVVARALDRFEAGELEGGVALEVLVAAQARGDRLGERARRWLGAVGLETDREAVERRRWALAGGDPAAGRQVFEGTGDCLRCHGAGGHGGGVGPRLGGPRLRDPGYVLESIVAPSAAFASGFEFRRVRDRDGRERVGRLVEASADSIVLEGEGGERVEIKRVDIAEASVEPSGMPPLGRGLSPRQLRDVLAFVVTLGRAEAGIQNELRERR